MNIDPFDHPSTPHYRFTIRNGRWLGRRMSDWNRPLTEWADVTDIITDDAAVTKALDALPLIFQSAVPYDCARVRRIENALIVFCAALIAATLCALVALWLCGPDSPL